MILAFYYQGKPTSARYFPKEQKHWLWNTPSRCFSTLSVVVSSFVFKPRIYLDDYMFACVHSQRPNSHREITLDL